MRTLTLLCLLLPALLAAPVASADEPPAEAKRLLTRWSEQMQALETMRVEFVQTKQLRLLRRPRKSVGVALVAGKRVRLTTRRAERLEVEMLIGDDVRIHYPRLKRLEIYPRQAEAAGKAPLPLLGGDVVAMLADHDAVVDTDDADRPRVTLTPTAKAAYVRLAMSFGEDGRLRRMVQRQANGDTLTLEVTRYVDNPTLPEQTFVLTPPAGTEVVKLGR